MDVAPEGEVVLEQPIAGLAGVSQLRIREDAEQLVRNQGVGVLEKAAG